MSAEYVETPDEAAAIDQAALEVVYPDLTAVEGVLTRDEVSDWYAQLDRKATSERRLRDRVIDRLGAPPLQSKTSESHRLDRIEENLERLTGTLAASAQMRARVAPPTESRRVEEPPASSGQGAGNRPPEARPTPPAPQGVDRGTLARITSLRAEMGIHDNTDLRGMDQATAQILVAHLLDEVGQRTSGS